MRIILRMQASCICNVNTKMLLTHIPSNSRKSTLYRVVNEDERVTVQELRINCSRDPFFKK